MAQEHVVVLSGAGISAESGLATFRGMGGMWNEYRIEEVASIKAWYTNPALVLQFYNQRRKEASLAQPNEGHKALARLEEKYQVTIITQNVDDLHERAGSGRVIHLHGKLREVRSSQNSNLVFDIGDKAIEIGDLCPEGSQLRPNIVWFGEMVPFIETAADIADSADIFIVVGTSLVVHPAASLIHCVPRNTPKYIVDPNLPDVGDIDNLIGIAQNATLGLPLLADELLGRV